MSKKAERKILSFPGGVRDNGRSNIGKLPDVSARKSGNNPMPKKSKKGALKQKERKGGKSWKDLFSDP